MNRNYKVIWNASLNCFMAVSEYAKARGKSSKSSVSANATINTTSNLSSTRIFRITTIWLGLVTAGFSMQAIAVPCDASTEIKCGINATTGGLHGIAIGKNATVLGSQAIAIGGGSSGQNTTASGEQSIAIGANVESSGHSSIAIGGDDLDAASKTNYDGSISTGALNSGQVNMTFHEYAGRDLLESWDAYGHHTEASGAASIAMGAKARSAGNLATAIGIHSSASGMASSAFGIASAATGQGALALGAGANSSTQDGVALGSRSVANVASGALGFAPTSASAADQSAITATNSTNLGAVSIGSAKDGTRQIVNLAAGTKDSDAVNVAQLKSVSNTVIANKTKYYSVNSGAVGNADNLGATKPNAMAMGGNASATGGQAIAIGSGESGQNTTASGEQSIAIGANVESSGNSSIAIGGDDLDDASKVNGVNELFNTYTGSTDGLVTVGDYNNHTESGGTASVAIGVKAHSKGNLSTAVGVRSSSSGDASSAFGMGSSASKKGSVALGAGSTTLTDTTYQDKLTIGNKDYLYAGATNDKGAQVSVGSSGRERQIKHVASGEVSAVSTDAINGSQLHATNEAIGDLGSTVSDGLNFVGDRGAVINRQLGDTLNIKGGAAPTTPLTNKNIGIRNDGSNGLIVELAEKVNLGTNGSVNIGNTQVKNTGITIAGSTLSNTVVLNNNGLNNGGFKVVNIDKGNVNATSTEAINGSQLFGTAQSIADNFGGGSIVNADGTVSNPVYQINGNNQTGVAGAIEELDKGFNLETNGANTSTVKAGDTIDIGTSTGETNIEVAKTGNDIKFKLADNIDLNSVKTGNSVLNNNGLTINNGPSFTATGINAGNQQITKVSSGGKLTDINNQLNAANIGDVKNAIGDVTTLGFGIKTADNNTVQKNLGEVVQIVGSNSNITTKVVNGKVAVDLNNNLDLGKTGSVKMGNTTVSKDGMTIVAPTVARTVVLSSAGLNNGGNKIINVKAGEADTDAVNVKQLNLANTTIDKGLSFGGDSGDPVNRKLGETLTVKGGDTINADPATKNISVTANGEDTLTVRLAKDINLGETGSVTTGNTQVNNDGITLYRGGNGQVALTNNGLNNGNNKITNVAEGTTSTDAVNFDQLSLTNTNVSTNAAGIKTNKDNIAKGIKIGDGNSANDQQFALGDTINVTGDSNITTTASATGVQVKLNNQLNLGDEGRMQMGTSLINNTGFTFVGNEPGRTVILGAGGLNNGFNRITNVAAGLAPTDAATVGQLSAATFALDKGWALSAQGDEATMVKQGSAVDLNSRDGNIKISRTAAASSVGRVSRAVDPNDMTFDLNRDIAIDSVQTGDTTINNQGLTIVGGPSVTKAGINAADTKVTNVVNGEVAANSKDAINGGQLYAQGAGISSIIGGNTTYDPVTGTFTNSNIGGTGQASIDGAIASIKRGEAVMTESIQTNTTNITTNTSNITKNTANIATNTANISTNTTNIKANKDKIDAGLNFGADSGAIINKPIGDGSVMSFKGGNNIKTTAEGSSIKFDLNGNINVESVTTGNTTVNNSGMTIKNGPSMTAAGIYAGNTETAPSMTTAGINAAGTKVTNVADGMAPRDAVNYGQFEAVTRGLGGSINELGYKIGEVEDDANAGISAAMAMSSLPQAYIIGKPMIGGGIATFNGESAVAIGFSKMSNDGRWVMKLNGTADTQGNVGGAIGAGFHFD